MLTKVITTKSVYGDKERILETVMSDKTKEHFLYRVFGAIEAQQTGKSRHKRVDKETGEAVDTFWTRFYGEFYAVSADKKQFEAATMFLPDYVSGGFKEQLEQGVTEIVFAFDIFSVYSKDSITSYEFVAQPVKSGEEKSKALAMADALPALPGEAPKKLLQKK